MSELGEVPAALESALGAAFSDAPVEKPAPRSQRPAEPDEAEESVEVVEPAESDPADLLQGQEVEEAPEAKEPASEPEFEIELDGKPEVIKGADRIKEVLVRGLKAGRGFEENARVREALQAHVQQVQMRDQFNQAVSQDIVAIQALEQQLQGFEQMDWNAAFSNDPFEAMKLKEQRDQLRERRAAAINNYNAKQQQFTAYVQQHTQKALAAENEALLAKVPAWRNAEKAKQEQGEIASVLTSHYGFTSQEVGSVLDHRHLLVARDAAAYRKLLANKDAKVKQAREAPATAKPGAAATQTNGRAEFAKAKGLLKAHGAKGNHRAQEELAAKLLGAAFK